MSFKLTPLPFENNALEPYISSATINLHYSKHHQTYLDNLNNLIKDTNFENMPLVDIIKISEQDKDKTLIFNNAAQVYNHDFFWTSISPNGGGLPSGKIKELIDENFGSFEGFYDLFKKTGLSQFGSGWVWLVQTTDHKLKIIKTSNAYTPITTDEKPLVTCDVWEHAYYVDYQNRRADFIDVFLKHLINWDFINHNL